MDILDLADKAARTVLAGRPYWRQEDWEDATQEAAIGILEAIRRESGQHEGYLFQAAKNGIYSWMRVWLRHYRLRAGALLDYVEYPQPEHANREAINLDRLRIALQFQRAENIGRDIHYLELRMDGVSTAGIAHELGVSERIVYSIRERLLPRLKRIERGEDPPPMVWQVRESSKAALVRINSDPDALRRRGDAIRAAKARKTVTR